MNRRRALLACELWLLAGFIGASVVAGGLLLALEAGQNMPMALVLGCGGAVLARTGWLRGLRVLERAERESVVADPASTRLAPSQARHSRAPLLENPNAAR